MILPMSLCSIVTFLTFCSISITCFLYWFAPLFEALAC
jgi:hypothetical protein